MQGGQINTPEVFKALGDPIRWAIVRQIADEPELAGSALEESLPVSRPTISYHIRILAQSGLIDVTKRGRNHYYSLRHDVLRDLIGAVSGLLPALQLVPGENAPLTSAEPSPVEGLPAVGGQTAVLPTW